MSSNAKTDRGSRLLVESTEVHRTLAYDIANVLSNSVASDYTENRYVSGIRVFFE